MGERIRSHLVRLSQPGGTASVLPLRALVAYARSIELDVDRLLRTAGVPLASLDDIDARIPEAAVQRAWAAVAGASSDEALGLEVALRFEEGAFDVLDYAVSFSSTVLDALGRFARFHRLIADATAIDIVRDQGVIRVVRLVSGTHPQDQDVFLVGLCNRLRKFTGRDLVPQEAWLEHPPHAERRLAAFFRCPIRFNRAHSELVLAMSDGALPLLEAKPRLAAILDRYMTDLLGRLPRSTSYVDHVRNTIAALVRHTPPTLPAVAKAMHASPRTIQRRLREAGTTLTKTVDELRRELATRYIESPELSITEIAFLLGYEDVSSFRGAYRRWTGKSPKEARGELAFRTPLTR